MNDGIFIPKIGFDMPITELIFKLELLRYKILSGTTHRLVFYQLRSIFYMIESIGSSRIEGNNTTVLDYVETEKLTIGEVKKEEKDDIREILNIENAMRYLEQNIDNIELSINLVRELHMLAVEGLSPSKEGAEHPGDFRKQNVRINGANHTPPDSTMVLHYMQELMDFINKEDDARYDLIKIAIAHHRFVWIHPFENGNGRVVRLFTYAMLLKRVFTSKTRLINPTAVFCANRTAYYENLAKADTGTEEGMIDWITYMLNGLATEVGKLDQLCDYDILKSKILIPSIKDAISNRYLTQDQADVLMYTINSESQELQSADLKQLMPGKSDSDRSRFLKSMRDAGLLIPIKENGRKYVISFHGNFWLRSVLGQLSKEGFLPDNLS